MDRERLVFVACAAGILFWQLILPPVVGLANNGDFSKTYGIFNLTEPPADEVKFADTQFQFNPQSHYRSGFYSSEQLLLLPALALNAVFSKDGSFDLRLIGMVHAVLFLCAAWLFTPLVADAPRRTRLIVYALALIMFGDVMYAAYLNSFYMDVAAYLFALLAAILYLRTVRWRRTSDTVLLAIGCVLLTTSKAQHAALGLWAAVLLYWCGADNHVTQRYMSPHPASLVLENCSLSMWKRGS